MIRWLGPGISLELESVWSVQERQFGSRFSAAVICSSLWAARLPHTERNSLLYPHDAGALTDRANAAGTV